MSVSTERVHPRVSPHGIWPSFPSRAASGCQAAFPPGVDLGWIVLPTLAGITINDPLTFSIGGFLCINQLRPHGTLYPLLVISGLKICGAPRNSNLFTANRDWRLSRCMVPILAPPKASFARPQSLANRSILKRKMRCLPLPARAFLRPRCLSETEFENEFQPHQCRIR